MILQHGSNYGVMKQHFAYVVFHHKTYNPGLIMRKKKSHKSQLIEHFARYLTNASQNVKVIKKQEKSEKPSQSSGAQGDCDYSGVLDEGLGTPQGYQAKTK